MRDQDPSAGRLEFADSARFRAAAHRSRRVYPGALGELVRRELTAYADFGHRFAGDTLMDRLTTEILEHPGLDQRLGRPCRATELSAGRPADPGPSTTPGTAR